MRRSGAPSTSSGRTVNTHTTLAPLPLQEGAHLLTFGCPRQLLCSSQSPAAPQSFGTGAPSASSGCTVDALPAPRAVQRVAQAPRRVLFPWAPGHSAGCGPGTPCRAVPDKTPTRTRRGRG
eukprot:14874248-Alexandrium_andersonii.AAC.1